MRNVNQDLNHPRQPNVLRFLVSWIGYPGNLGYQGQAMRTLSTRLRLAQIEPWLSWAWFSPGSRLGDKPDVRTAGDASHF